MNILNVLSSSNQFILRGNINNDVSGSVILSYYSLSNNKWELVSYNSIIEDGHFQFKGILKEPVRANLKIGENEITLYIEPTKMELYIPKTNSDKFSLKGSKTQEDNELLANEEQELVKLGDVNQKKAQRNYEQLKTMQETNSYYKRLLEEKELISLQRDSIYNLITKKETEFIKSNPNSYHTVIAKPIDILVSQGYLSVDSARALFDNLSEKVRLSTAGIQTNNFIKSKENFTVGKIAPDFFTPDTIGKMIKLSDFRGKSYVLLDFWASWCVPCVKGIPHMKVLYTKYHDKGLEIIGISCDSSKEEWITAIRKHQIFTWYNVLSKQSLERNSQGYVDPEDISEKYPTDGIPKYLLIDKTGKIIGKWEGYSEENEKEQDKILKEIFGEL